MENEIKNQAEKDYKRGQKDQEETGMQNKFRKTRSRTRTARARWKTGKRTFNQEQEQ